MGRSKSGVLEFVADTLVSSDTMQIIKSILHSSVSIKNEKCFNADISK